MESKALHSHCESMPQPLNSLLVAFVQVASGLDSLKAIGLIHCDLHMANIMVADHRAAHLNFKIIDFGLAIHKSKTSPGMVLQPLHFR